MLRHPKRPDILVDIARKAPDVNFVVCGGPSNFLTPSGYSERMAEQLRSLRNVEFEGQVAPAKAEQVIADAAILLCTSDEEGFPNTFTQAWSSGTPVISLKLDPGGLIEQRGLGVLSGSTEQAIADIRILLHSPQRRDDIAIRARRFIAENYSATAVVKLFERIVYDDGLSDTKNCTSLVISDDRR
jgi:glycosyltransferase involved in cell wall biosynthesis